MLTRQLGTHLGANYFKISPLSLRSMPGPINDAGSTANWWTAYLVVLGPTRLTSHWQVLCKSCWVMVWMWQLLRDHQTQGQVLWSLTPALPKLCHFKINIMGHTRWCSTDFSGMVRPVLNLANYRQNQLTIWWISVYSMMQIVFYEIYNRVRTKAKYNK